MSRVPFTEFLGIRDEGVTGDGRYEAVLDLGPHLTNKRGVAHGGVVAALLDTALGGAVIAAIPKEWWCATISLSVQFVAPARGDRLRAVGRFLRRGSRVAYARGEVLDERGHVVATAEGSWHLWPYRPGTGDLLGSAPFVVERGTGERIPVGKIVAVGRNYAAHVAEMGSPDGAPPVLFTKPPTALVHDGGEVVLPAGAGEVHHEVELVAVIGSRVRGCDEEQGLAAIRGFAVGLDMTLRDLQAGAKKAGEPWAVAKGFDTSAPVSLVTPRDEVGDGSNLAIRLSVNDEIRQDGDTGRMVHPVGRLVAMASRYMTLEPGDLLFTGTPEGVGPVRDGDRLKAEIERVGTLDVTVRAERSGSHVD